MNGKAGGATPPRVPQKHILSVDVEDYFQVEAFSGCVSRNDWFSFPSRVVGNCHRLLDLFDRYEVKATFFVMGWIAHHFPALVRELHQRGHELACHSYWHRPVFSLTPQEFRADTREARSAIEQAASVRVVGYRAPTWSITNRSLWALEILAEEGFQYDSSIYPIRHDLYGIPNASRYPYVHVYSPEKRLVEFPPTTARFAGLNIPAAGGGYLRLFPLAFTELVFQQYERCGESVVVYLHPWEIDPEQPRIAAKLRSRLRHYINLRRTEATLETLLKRHSFHPFRDRLTQPPQITVVPNAQLNRLQSVSGQVIHA